MHQMGRKSQQSLLIKGLYYMRNEVKGDKKMNIEYIPYKPRNLGFSEWIPQVECSNNNNCLSGVCSNNFCV